MRAIAALGFAALAAAFVAPPPAQAAAGAVIDSSACMDNWLTSNDDSSTSAVLLPFKVNYYGKTYERLYVNNNGNVTFEGPLSTYTPFGLAATRTPIIAPFFADVDTRGYNGVVGYGWGNTVYEGRPAFCVTWKAVGYYNNHNDKTNTFQMLLVQHGRSNDMDIVFNYDQVQWETGDASGGLGGLGGSSARVGFSNGSGQPGTFFEMPGSGVNGAFLDSNPNGLVKRSTDSSQPGRHIYRIRGGAAPLTRYVALGDSYSSGFGLGDYENGTHPDTWGGVNDCQRSSKAYSHYVADKLNLDIDFHACQGGVTDDFYNPRQHPGDGDGWQNWGESPQLDNLLTNDTRLVSLTIGGNDSKFADIYHDCAMGAELLPWNDCHEDDKVTEPLAAAFSALDGGVYTGDDSDIAKIHPYSTVFGDIRRLAPYSERVVIGYPAFFPEGGADTFFRCQGIKRVDQVWMRSKTMELNEIIKRNAALNGFRYVDPNPKFDDHRFCETDSWFYGVLNDGKVHPTRAGHQAMADAILTELTDDTRPHFLIKPYETVTTSYNVTSPQDAVNVGIEWPGSDIHLSLESPSGKIYNRTVQPGGATGNHGPTWDQLTVPHPELGTWQVSMYGADVDPQGEEAKLRVVQIEAPNKAPTGAFDMTVDGTTLKLDASKATDTDGTIASYDWYVQLADGTERVLHGTKAGTALPTGQQFKATLVVTDNDGASTFTSRSAVAATIDVKPDSADNPINVKSKGVTPIAILSTGDFDATQVQAGSVRVGPAGTTADKAGVQDVNRDGRADLLLHVSTLGMGLRTGDSTLSLSGTLRSGVPFVGADHIRVLQ